MKKMLSIILASFMLMSMLVGCGSNTGENSAASAEVTTEGEPSDNAEAAPESPTAASTSDKLQKPIKIGVTYLMNDGLFADCYKYMQYMADNLGFELIVDIGAFSPEEQVASVENLIAAGAQGIVFTNFSEACLPKIASICEEAGVYWAQSFRQIEDAEIREAVESYQYYLGRASEDTEMVAEVVAEQFKAKNLTKTAIVGPQTGDTTTDTISRRFKEMAAEYNMEVQTEVRNVDDAATATAAVENIVANFPDVEGICVLSGSTGKLEGVLEGLKNMDKLGQIYVGGNDASTTIEQDLASGNVLCESGGQYTDQALTAVMVVNAVNGTPLLPEGAKADMACNYLMFTTPEEAAMFNERMLNHDAQSYAYDADELRQMIKEFNPDFTYEDLQSIAAAYSFEDYIARHGE